MYKFIYPYENFTQKAFDGHDFTVRGYRGEGHILINQSNTTLCGETKEGLKLGVANIAILATRLNTVKLCKDCQEKWKTMPDSEWKKWVEGLPVQKG